MLQSSKNKKGVALILVIAIMLLSGIFIFSITMFVRESLDLALVKENRVKAINAAQSGVYKSVEDFRRLGYYNTETNTVIFGNEYYSIGQAANFLQVNASAVKFESGGTAISNASLKNIRGASSIALASIKISWTPNTSSEHLTNITVGGVSWAGSVNSGATVPLNYTFTAGSTAILGMKWDVVTTAKTVVCEFIFSDGSSVIATILSSGKTSANCFTIKSTGSVVSNITWKRTLLATYDVGTGKVTSWNETNSHI